MSGPARICSENSFKHGRRFYIIEVAGLAELLKPSGRRTANRAYTGGTVIKIVLPEDVALIIRVLCEIATGARVVP